MQLIFREFNIINKTATYWERLLSTPVTMHKKCFMDSTLSRSFFRRQTPIYITVRAIFMAFPNHNKAFRSNSYIL